MLNINGIFLVSFFAKLTSKSDYRLEIVKFTSPEQSQSIIISAALLKTIFNEHLCLSHLQK